LYQINQHIDFKISDGISLEGDRVFCPAKTRSGKIHQFRHYTTDAPV